MNYIFEKLELKHQKDVIDILNHYIENTFAAYREETVSYEHFHRFLDEDDVHCGFAITDLLANVVGFCLLEPYGSHSTFRETAEVMYFVHPEHTGKGIGTAALKKLNEESRKRGITHLLADIASENKESIRFHEKNGFSEYGRLKNIGKKRGQYFSVVYMGLEID